MKANLCRLSLNDIGLIGFLVVSSRDDLVIFGINKLLDDLRSVDLSPAERQAQVDTIAQICTAAGRANILPRGPLHPLEQAAAYAVWCIAYDPYTYRKLQKEWIEAIRFAYDADERRELTSKLVSSWAVRWCQEVVEIHEDYLDFQRRINAVVYPKTQRWDFDMSENQSDLDQLRPVIRADERDYIDFTPRSFRRWF